jgi:hypothetical protein
MADNNKTLVAYFQSWSEKWSDDPKKLQLANIASYVNMVIVSFLKPDATYEGGNKLSGTGLDFSADGVVVKDAIAYLKSKNPNIKVLVAVGGATYQNFAALNTKAIANPKLLGGDRQRSKGAGEQRRDLYKFFPPCPSAPLPLCLPPGKVTLADY